MANFVELAVGVDVLPLAMAVERQRSVLGEAPKTTLFETTWTGEYYAFPQMRDILLNVMRRVECGRLVEVAFWRPGDYPRLGDASVGLVLVGIIPGIVWCGDESEVLAPGRVLFSAGVENLALSGKPDSCALAVIFEPLP